MSWIGWTIVLAVIVLPILYLAFRKDPQRKP